MSDNSKKLSQDQSIELFKEAMQNSGIVCPIDIISDGTIHRFPTKNKSKKNGWYVFYGNAGSYGDWGTGVTGKWSILNNLLLHSFSPEQKHKIKQEIKQSQQAAEKERNLKQQEAAQEANNIWQQASEVGTSEYLKTKKVEGYGVRYGEDKYGSFIAVPIKDIAGGLWNVQRIYSNQKDNNAQNKWFLRGGKKKGCFHVLGTPLSELNPGDHIWVAEGYSTAASAHMATNSSVVMAIDASNIGAVVKSISSQYPELFILIIADNDRYGNGSNLSIEEKNTGVKSAKEAAEKYNCSVFIPQFSDEYEHLKLTDINDLHRVEGLEEVKKRLKSFLDQEKKAREAVLLENKNNDKERNDLEQDIANNIKETGNPQDRYLSALYTDKISKKRFPYREYRIIEGILFQRTISAEKYKTIANPRGTDEITQKYLPISSEIHVITRGQDNIKEDWDKSKRSWSSAVVFKDFNGKETEMIVEGSWFSPGNYEKLGEALRKAGLRLYQTTPKCLELLAHYLDQESTQNDGLIVHKPGWYGNGFILPNKILPENKKGVFYHNCNNPIKGAVIEKGSHKDWLEKIAHPCIGNHRLIFSLSAGLACTLLPLLGFDSFSILWRGKTSDGKTSLLKLVASLYGDFRGYVKSADSTINAADTLFESCNHMPVLIDETAQMKDSDIKEFIYKHGNGKGRSRSNKDGTAQEVKEWNNILQFSGEEHLHDKIRASGNCVKGGIDSRCHEIEADAGKGLGIFDHLPHFITTSLQPSREDSKRFINYLLEEGSKNYGTAAPKFISWVIINKDQIIKDWPPYRDNFHKNVVPTTSEGQLYRIADHYAIIEYAGVLAYKAEVLPFSQDEVQRSVQFLFGLIIEKYGTKNSEDLACFEQIVSLIQQHQYSRFQFLNNEEEGRVEDNELARASLSLLIGFQDKDWFYVYRNQFSEVLCKGYNYKNAHDLLIERGFSKKDSSPRRKGRTIPKTIGGKTQSFIYISKNILSTNYEDNYDDIRDREKSEEKIIPFPGQRPQSLYSTIKDPQSSSIEKEIHKYNVVEI